MEHEVSLNLQNPTKRTEKHHQRSALMQSMYVKKADPAVVCQGHTFSLGKFQAADNNIHLQKRSFLHSTRLIYKTCKSILS